MTSSFIFQVNLCGYSPHVTYFLTKGCVCRLQLLLVLARAVILRYESCGTQDHFLLSQIRDSHNLEGLVPVFLSLRNKVTRLHPQILGSFRRLLRLAGLWWRYSTPPPYRILIPAGMASSLYSLEADPQETPFPSLSQQFLYCYRDVPTLPLYRNGSSSIVAYVFDAAGMCLSSRCLAMDVCYGSIIPTFRRQGTIY
jgi:hypothetical protein